MKHFSLQATQPDPFKTNPMQDRSTEGKGNLLPAEAALASNRTVRLRFTGTQDAEPLGFCQGVTVICLVFEKS